MNDIFKDMQAKVGCEYISDLPYRKREVWEIIKQHSPLAIQRNNWKNSAIMCSV